MWQLRKENWLLPSKKRKKKKKVKMKFIDLDHAGNGKLLNRLLLSLRCWLMLARRLSVYNAGLKVDAAWEILIVIMTLNDENVGSCERLTVVFCAFWFCFCWLLCPFLASQLTTVSLEPRCEHQQNLWCNYYILLVS